MPTSRRTFNFPTRIEYGPGAMIDLAGIIKGKGFSRGLIVTDGGIVKAGVADALLESCKSVGLEMTIFQDVKSNPTDDNVFDGVDLYKKVDAEFVVALGGGSPIDVGKTIKVMVAHDGPLEKYDDMKGGDRYIVNPMPPFYAIATTAGTGSEVGRSSVITIKATNKKTIIFAPSMMPDIAVLDPEATLSLPAGLTAATGVDALVHNLEAHIMQNYHPMADGIAKEGILRIFKNLPIAFKDGGNVGARGEMLMASAMGATAFQKGLGVNHAIAHAMGVLHDTHHGLANAAILVEVMKYNLSIDSVRDKLANLGAMLGIKKDADAFIELLAGWLAELELPAKITDLAMNANHIQALEDYALQDPCAPLNPRKVEKGDVVKILSKLV